MAKRCLVVLVAFSAFLFSSAPRVPAQESEPSIRVEVDMVQLNVAVMDSKGNYVTGLKPSDFEVDEDGIQQKVATFGEGNEATRRVTSNAISERLSRFDRNVI
jgi:Ca-activated chloride channel family protein